MLNLDHLLGVDTDSKDMDKIHKVQKLDSFLKNQDEDEDES